MASDLVARRRSRDHRRVRALVAVVVAGCFDPHPQPGGACADGRCPTGLVCAPATDTCELSAGDAPDAGTAPRLIQEATAEAAHAESLAATLPSPPQPGHVLVVIGGAPSGGLATVSGAGATWTRATRSLTNANIEVWLGTGAAGDTDGSVTIARPGNTLSMTLAVSEWSGLSATPLDAALAAPGATDPATAGAITTTAPALAVFAVAADQPSTYAAPTPGAWTALAALTGPVAQAAWYRLEPAATSLSPTVSGAQGRWDAALVALHVGP